MVKTGGFAVVLVTDWRDRLDELDSEHRHMLEGGSLSQLFLRYPLYASHPVFIGSFYGFLVGLTLLLPYAYFGNVDDIPIMDSLRDWGIQTLMLITLSSFLGGSSSIIASISRIRSRKRPLFGNEIPCSCFCLFSFGFQICVYTNKFASENRVRENVFIGMCMSL